MRYRHAIDDIVGEASPLSSDDDYREAVERDVESLSDSHKQKYAYYLHPKRRYRETFAENFSHLSGGSKFGIGHEKLFQNSLSVMREKLRKRGITLGNDSGHYGLSDSDQLSEQGGIKETQEARQQSSVGDFVMNDVAMKTSNAGSAMGGFSRQSFNQPVNPGSAMGGGNRQTYQQQLAPTPVQPGTSPGSAMGGFNRPFTPTTNPGFAMGGGNRQTYQQAPAPSVTLAPYSSPAGPSTQSFQQSRPVVQSAGRLDEAFAKLTENARKFPDQLDKIASKFSTLETALEKYNRAMADKSGTVTQQRLRRDIAGKNLDEAMKDAHKAPETSGGGMMSVLGKLMPMFMGSRGGMVGALAGSGAFGGAASGGGAAAGLAGGPVGLAVVGGVMALGMLKDATMGVVNKFTDLASMAANPKGVVGGFVSPFTSQVGAYSPASVDRFNLALDNLSASVGVWFQPIIDSARDFADEWNRINSSVGPDIRSFVEAIIPPLKEAFTGGVGAFVDLLAFGAREMRPIVEAFAPAGKIATRILEKFGELGESVIRVFEKAFGGQGGLISTTEGLMKVFDSLADTLEDLIDVIMKVQEAYAESAGSVSEDARERGNALREWLNAQGLQLNVARFGGIFNAIRPLGEEEQRTRRERPTRNAFTHAAQEARHIGIEEVGLEARRAAFSQGTDYNQQTAGNTEQILQILRDFAQRFFGLNIPNLPIVMN